MASELDVELEQYEEVGNLNFSTTTGSRSASPYHRSALTFQEPIQQVDTISPCATTYPRPGPADSHALIPQVPWIPGSCQHQQTQSHQCSREFLSLAACVKYKVIPSIQGQGQELGL